ncbi:hypothetical protein ACO0R3_003168 [Hanseniaspora guilliermondii]
MESNNSNNMFSNGSKFSINSFSGKTTRSTDNINTNQKIDNLHSKNIFNASSKSLSSSMINPKGTPVNKSILSLKSNNNSNSETSISLSSKNESSTAANKHMPIPVGVHTQSEGDLPMTQGMAISNGNIIKSRLRSNTAGKLTSTASMSNIHTMPSEETSKPNKKPKSQSKDITKMKAPNVLNIFKRTEVIGRGKFGVVYKGYHMKTKHVYAIKVLNLDSNEDEIEDVQQEIKFLSSSRNIQNVTKYYGSYLHDTKLWIIMEYCAGGSLRTLLRAGVLNDEMISVIFRELLYAVSAIHHDKLIHRDIKAANVLIGYDGKVKLCDFGVAAKLTQTRPRRQSLAGTPFWMAPEVITESSTYDSKADIWSLGITVFESATGNPPYCDVDAMRAMQMIAKNKPPRLEGKQYSSDLKEFVALCLDENPYERSSASELLKSQFISKYGSVKVSVLKELIVRYNNYKNKNKNDMSLTDNEPSSLNAKPEKNKSIKTSNKNTSKSNKDIKSGSKNIEKIISSSNAVNIPSTPMPLAPSMGDRTYSDVFGAAFARAEEGNNVIAEEKEDSSNESTESNSSFQWDFDTHKSNEKEIKAGISEVMNKNDFNNINDEPYWNDDNNDDDKQPFHHFQTNTTMRKHSSYFNTQTAAPASMIHSYHPHHNNVSQKTNKPGQQSIRTGNLKFSSSFKYSNNTGAVTNAHEATYPSKQTPSYNIYSNNYVPRTINNNVGATEKDSRMINTKKLDVPDKYTSGRHNVKEGSEIPMSLLRLFEDLDAKPPNELELPLMTPTPMGDYFGHEPKSYFESAGMSKPENYPMYKVKNKKYLQDGKTSSTLSLNTDGVSTPLSVSESNVVEIEIPDELPVATTPSMASIPSQIKTRSRSSTLNAVLSKNANNVAKNMEIHRRGTVSSGYLKNPGLNNNSGTALNSEARAHGREDALESNKELQQPRNMAPATNTGRSSPIKIDLKINTSSTQQVHNPKGLLEDGNRKSPNLTQEKNSSRMTSPNQRNFYQEPLSAMTPSSTFIPSPKRKRNLSMAGGQQKPNIGVEMANNNAEIMNTLLQPFNNVSNDDIGGSSISLSVSQTPEISSKRLTRDFRKNNPNLKLEMPLPKHNMQSHASTTSSNIDVSTGLGPTQSSTSVNQFGFNTNNPGNVAYAMTPLAEKSMMFTSGDIKRSEALHGDTASGEMKTNTVNERSGNNLAGIVEETYDVSTVKRRNNINEDAENSILKKAKEINNGTNGSTSNVNDDEHKRNESNGVMGNSEFSLGANMNDNVPLKTPGLTPGLVTNFENGLLVSQDKKPNDVNYFGSSSGNLINKLESLNSEELKNYNNSHYASVNERKSSILSNHTDATFVKPMKNSDNTHATQEPGATVGSPVGMLGNEDDNGDSGNVINTNIINRRISSKTRSLSNSQVTTPKLEEFADMRIMFLDYPALKENERDIIEELEGTDVDEVDNSEAEEIKEILEEEKDHYYYYAVEQEQRDILMRDLNQLMIDYETAFGLLENEYKIFEETLN